MRTRTIKTLIISFLFIIVATFIIFSDNLLHSSRNSNDRTVLLDGQADEMKVLKTKNDRNHEVKNIFIKDGVHTFIGEEKEKIVQIYGEPKRIDLSAYDYEWWIYDDVYENGYLQVGIEDGKIVTIYCIGENMPTEPISMGASYQSLQQLFSFYDKVSLNLGNNSYQFKLTEEDMKMRPLVAADGVYIQFYFDTVTETLSSIRYLDGKTLVKHRPYSVSYRGELIEPKSLTEKQWREVERGSAQQIFDITNQMRKRSQLFELQWDREVAVVATSHSEDMFMNDYFSHTSPTEGELKDRLKKQGILYQMAAENIAAKYVDAIAATEGWLNSEGHRINLLHDQFSHIGIGVYERYYTQNFITPW